MFDRTILLCSVALFVCAAGCTPGSSNRRIIAVASPEEPSPALAAAPDAGAREGPVEGPISGTTDTAVEAPMSPPDLLYLKRLDFRRGAPTLSVRLMEGREEVRFVPRGRMRMMVYGPVPKLIESPPGIHFRVRILSGMPSRLRYRVLFTEAPFRERERVAGEQRQWEERGVATGLRTVGVLYGVAGKVIDNRRYQLVSDSMPEGDAAALQQQILRRFAIRTTTIEELEEKPTGVLEISDASGAVIAVAQNLAVAESLDGAGFDVKEVEHDVSYPSHGFEDRSFRGGLRFAPDRRGKLAVINLVSLEELARGVVPSEIFPRAHPEALKAQAVTARAEVLAKIGLRHLTDPYLLCAEQHCSVYKGLTGESAATNAAVEATRGEGLFSAGGELVNAVYSAVCGGYTEDNDAVWGTPADPNLRGRPDLLNPSPIPEPRQDLAAFLSASIPAACRLSTWAQPGKFRWERRFASAEIDSLAAPLKLGRVRAIMVTERGISGRAKVVTVAGEDAATQLRGELNIRRFFKMLNSSMFEVSAERDPSGAAVNWIFRGGGWGHGVGMCQTGAIGRAEAGQNYREILRYYYSGAEVVPIY